MVNSWHSRDGVYYNATTWLLNNYRNFKYLNISDTSDYMIENKADMLNSGNVSEEQFGLKELVKYAEMEEARDRRLELIWKEYKVPVSDRLAKVMEHSLHQFRQSGLEEENDADLIEEFYMKKEHIFTTVSARIEATGYKRGSFYAVLRRALEGYSKILWRNLFYYKELPFYGRSIEQSVNVIDMMKEATETHSVGGPCYKETVQLLKYYRAVTYSGVQKRIQESNGAIEEYLGGRRRKKAADILDMGEIPGVSGELKSWMHSSMMETTAAYISYIESGIRCLKTLGAKGAESERIIRVCYTQYKYYYRSWEEKAKALGYSQRSFYCKRKESISQLSRILWGSLACKHSSSQFYKK